MIEHREDEIRRLIEEDKDVNSAVTLYAAHLLFGAEAYAA